MIERGLLCNIIAKDCMSERKQGGLESLPCAPVILAKARIQIGEFSQPSSMKMFVDYSLRCNDGSGVAGFSTHAMLAA
jgi:hypothetical protein